MDLVSIALVSGALLAFALVSGRLQGTIVTPPLVFIVFGYLIGQGVLGIANVDPGHGAIHVIAELTLILVLFSDAARINLAQLRRDHDLPLRMLLIGLPLTMVGGAWLALMLFPQLDFWEAVLLAALLAPTDAALGQSVVSAKAVPVRIRQAINVESGLNDGIALPAVLLFAALASAQQESAEAAEWLSFALFQVTLGPLAGALVGFVGARLLDSSAHRGWADTAFQGIGILSLAVFAFAVAELIGGNGFIAAFIGGMVLGATVRHPCTFLFEFMEAEGLLLMLITFLVFGAALLPEGLEHVSAATVVYALLSLTVVRMLPVAISLIGTGLRLRSVMFLGWFGPRGLASILFVLLILEKVELVHRTELLSITVITVGLSALLHGLSAAPLAKLYGRHAARMGECQENMPVSEMPLREGLNLQR
jgi:NhaP-type Na+/H+ or K+/H+ antiporter